MKIKNLFCLLSIFGEVNTTPKASSPKNFNTPATPAELSLKISLEYKGTVKNLTPSLIRENTQKIIKDNLLVIFKLVFSKMGVNLPPNVSIEQLLQSASGASGGPNLDEYVKQEIARIFSSIAALKVLFFVICVRSILLVKNAKSKSIFDEIVHLILDLNADIMYFFMKNMTDKNQNNNNDQAALEFNKVVKEKIKVIRDKLLILMNLVKADTEFVKEVKSSYVLINGQTFMFHDILLEVNNIVASNNDEEVIAFCQSLLSVHNLSA